jgi:hypothetical protein
MLERVRTRLTGSVLLWDVLITLGCLFLASQVRHTVGLGYDLSAQHVVLPWVLYLAVGLIWVVVFLLLTPQRALFVRSLIEAIGRLVAAVALASASFAGLLYLSFRDVSRLQFLYFVALDLLLLLAFHLAIRSWLRFQGARVGNGAASSSATPALPSACSPSSRAARGPGCRSSAMSAISAMHQAHCRAWAQSSRLPSWCTTIRSTK